MFYKTHQLYRVYPGYLFWRVVNNDQPRVHYPLASAISNAFGSLLFSNTPKFSVETGSKARNKKYEQRLSEIFQVNDMLSLLQQGAQLQSYSGGVALKLNIDYTLADTPLISAYPQEQYREQKKYGQTVYIDFVDEYKNGEYKLVSRYGRGYISYKLYRNGKQVLLNDLEETKDLKDIVFLDQNGALLNVIFGINIPNRSNNRSDYEGLVSSFHALDEAYSNMVNYLRKTKPNIFISEDIAPKDSYGKAKPLNYFDNNITILDSTPEGTNTSIERDLPDVKVDGYRQSFLAIREAILMSVGLSPSTLGIDGAGANVSGEALNIRERASGRSRNEKLAVWSERLDTFLYATLIFDEAIKNGVVTDGTVRINEIPTLEVKVDFGPMWEKSIGEKMAVYAEAIKNKLASVEFAVQQIYGDMLSDEELQRLIIEIKQQNGMQLTAEETVAIAPTE
jgi:hypothetical protein